MCLNLKYLERLECLEAAMGKVTDKVDVICEHKADGSVIPLRFRIMNEEGEYEAFTIKGYRMIHVGEARTTADGVYICGRDRVFECRVIILNTYRTVRLYFSEDCVKWRLAI